MAARSPATLAAAPDAPLRRAWLPRRHPKPGAAGGGPGGAGRACCRAATLLLLLLALLAAPRLLLLPSPPRAAAPAPPPPAAATTALAVSSPPPPPPADPVDVALAGFAANSTLFVTFATSSMTLFLLNWAAHARAAGISPLLVGAFDEPVLRACAGAQLPAVYLAAERVVGGGYVSVHHPAFKRMGVQKVIFLQRLLARGVHVALSDADALWVADPRPFFSGKGLDKADVLVSTDCIDMDADRLTDGGGPCNRRVNFNTGARLRVGGRGVAAS